MWGRVLETLWQRGCVDADRMATDVELSAGEVRTVCEEMAAMGWLEHRAEAERWVAGESAAELLRRYPALRADVATPRIDGDEGPNGLASASEF